MQNTALLVILSFIAGCSSPAGTARHATADHATVHSATGRSASGEVASSDWPLWRGPAGNGVAAGATVPVEWSRDENVKWKTPLAMPANGSPIVSNGRVFLCMPLDEDGRERALLCFDRETGAELWSRSVEVDEKMPTHKTNPYCGSTPAADGERVVVWHSSGGLVCYDFEGEELWRRDFGSFRHMWGYGTSPVLVDGRVILHSGPGDTSFVAALDFASGETIWRTDEPNHLTPEDIEKKRIAGSWCTPVLVRGDERDLVICTQPTRVCAYDLADGSIVWSCDGLVSERGDLAYSSPTIGGDVCLVVGGYEGPTIGIRLGGEGDVTESHRMWRHAQQMSNCSSGVFADGHFFVPDMRGFLWCIDPQSGERKWRERLGRGASWGSIVAAAGRLYLMDQDGTTTVFAPEADEFTVLARNELEETTNSTPAVAGDELFLRTHEHLWCIAVTD